MLQRKARRGVEPRSIKLSMRITAELRDGLEAIAIADQRSMAATVERILQAYVAEHQQQQAPRKRR